MESEATEERDVIKTHSIIDRETVESEVIEERDVIKTHSIIDRETVESGVTEERDVIKTPIKRLGENKIMINYLQ